MDPWNFNFSPMPFGFAKLGAGFLNNPQDIARHYNSAYRNALAQNQTLYNNILSGYQQAAKFLDTAGATRKQEIADAYSKAEGDLWQSLSERGLAGSTSFDMYKTALIGERTKAETALAESKDQQRLGWSDRLLQWMNSVRAGYPDASQYYALMQQSGMGGAPGIGGGGAGGGGFRNSPNMPWSGTQRGQLPMEYMLFGQGPGSLGYIGSGGPGFGSIQQPSAYQMPWAPGAQWNMAELGGGYGAGGGGGFGYEVGGGYGGSAFSPFESIDMGLGFDVGQLGGAFAGLGYAL